MSVEVKFCPSNVAFLHALNEVMTRVSEKVQEYGNMILKLCLQFIIGTVITRYYFVASIYHLLACFKKENLQHTFLSPTFMLLLVN